jgi:hypothetical protein
MDGRIDIAPLGARHERSKVSPRDSNRHTPRHEPPTHEPPTHEPPTQEPPTPEPPTPELVLAAIERAALHRAKASAAVPAWAVAEHLAVSQRSAAWRRPRAELEALEAAGSIERTRRHGVQMWALTAAGRLRLRGAREAGNLPPLPESPQHRAWRAAQAAAAQEVGRFAGDLAQALDEAARLLELESPARADEWFALGERLQQAARRLGSASYCLHEWLEPSDDRADIDDHHDPADAALHSQEQARRRARRFGRRNIRLWQGLGED